MLRVLVYGDGWDLCFNEYRERKHRVSAHTFEAAAVEVYKNIGADTNRNNLQCGSSGVWISVSQCRKEITWKQINISILVVTL
mmetsp:Transcript_26670/g.55676  ORF Transcript_26670/g.55676 Transcript_26670/m.55676 type:complete len:83 (+) Transcript_26670:759-1007(+)